MKIYVEKIDSLVANPDNPRVIAEDKFKMLVQSVKEFPEMLKMRPIVVDEDNVVLGGNMRLEACRAAGMTEVYVYKATGLSEDQKKEFVVKDNVPYGSWNWDALANEWTDLPLNDWGLDVWQPEVKTDYSILDEYEDVEQTLSDMEESIMKSFLIAFTQEDYEEAVRMMKVFRAHDVYAGGIVLRALRDNLPE